MLVKKIIASILFSWCMITLSFGQRESLRVYQMSGFVITQSGPDLEPIAYANVAVVGTSRGTATNNEGFYSLVVKAGDLLEFSALGFKSVQYMVPDTNLQWLYVNEVLEKDPINLPEITVYPIPSPQNFKIEFLAMKVDNELQARALENLQPYTMAQLAKYLPYSGRELAPVYFNQIAIQNYSAGQYKPMAIFNPLAWQKFIKYVKEGRFKNKKETK